MEIILNKTQTKTMLSAKHFLESAYDSGKLGGLTPYAVGIMADCYNAIVNNSEHCSETIDEAVANKFKKLGFKVCSVESETENLHWHINII